MSNETKSTKPEAVRNRTVNGKQTYLSFPVVPYPHGIQFIFKEFDYGEFVVNKRGLNEPKPKVEGTRSIELPFPKTMTDATGVRLVSFERNFLTERIAASLAGQMGTGVVSGAMNLASAGATILQNLGATLARDPGGAFEMVKSGLMSVTGESAANAARLATFMIRNFLPEELGKTTGALTGAAINPNETLGFEGVNLKNYSFAWDLYPSNAEDSRLIEQIVRLCKREALPRLSSGGLNSLGPFETAGINVGRVFLKYPSVVTINLLGVKPTAWMRFKPAMITDITVDYAAGGTMGIMQGGVPAGVNLSMSFSELSIHTAEDYDYSTYMGSYAGGSFEDPTG